MIEEMELTSLKQLTKDIKKGAKTLGVKEARYLTDTYYDLQDFRIQTQNKIRGLIQSDFEEPCETILYFKDNFSTLEENLKKVLDSYTDGNIIGQWCKSIVGIGPVIAAGLLSNLDVKDKPTAGHFWSYCGLNDNNRPWIGREKTKKIIDEVLGDKKSKDITYEDFCKCCVKTQWKPENLIEATGKDGKKIFYSKDGKEYSFKKEDIINQCAKRPYNAKVKTLCCHPNTLIRTIDGYKEIKDIKVGDYVLTHKGNYKKVTKTFVNSCEDNELISLSTIGQGMMPLMVTGYHPIYTYKTKVYDITKKYGDREIKSFRRKETVEYAINKGDVKTIKELKEQNISLTEIAKKFNVSVPYISKILKGKTKIEERFEEAKGWMPAKEVKGGNLGLAVKSLNFKEDISYIEIDSEDTVSNDKGDIANRGRWITSRAPKASFFNPKIELTDDVLRFIGLFIAEGHTSKNTIGFSYNSKEEEYIDFTRKMIKLLFNQEAAVINYKDKNCTQVTFVNKAVARTFGKLFGKGAKNKRIPLELLNTEKVKKIVKGLFEGDGTLDSKYIQFTTISKDLALQVYDILISLNISTRVTKQERYYKVSINDDVLFLETIFNIIKEDTKKGHHYKRDDIEECGTWYQFDMPKKVEYKGLVYNLEVEDDNSYIANGIAVHNCWKLGQSFVKTCNNPNSVYGKIYQQRKAYEMEKNERREYKEQAEAKAKIVGKTTEAYKYYSDGMLPPAHIQARAERYAVRIFISHLHKVMYMVEYGVEPPKPFAIQILGHGHEIQVPNLEMITEYLKNRG